MGHLLGDTAVSREQVLLATVWVKSCGARRMAVPENASGVSLYK